MGFLLNFPNTDFNAFPQSWGRAPDFRQNFYFRIHEIFMACNLVKNKYVVCPLCGWNKVLVSNKRAEKGKASEFEYPDVNLSTAFLLQVREGGGKKAGSGAKGRGKAPGSGFFLIPAESLTLSQMMADSEYSALLRQMKDRLIDLVKKSVEIGFIRKEEI